MHHQPQGAAFDIVLLLHVACVVVAFATVVTSAATAARLRKVLVAEAPFPDALVRYFHPGVNWAGRATYGIPVFGVALVAMSRGAYSLGDGWVSAGLAVFVVVVLVSEGVLWPAERRLQTSLEPYRTGGTSMAPSVGRDVTVMARAGMVATVLLIAGSVLMVAQP